MMWYSVPVLLEPINALENRARAVVRLTLLMIKYNSSCVATTGYFAKYVKLLIKGG